MLSITLRIQRNLRRAELYLAEFDGGTQTAAQVGRTAQFLWQGPAQARVGDTFALQLVMRADQPVVCVPLAIRFDPRLLQAANVNEGRFLRQGGAQTAPRPDHRQPHSTWTIISPETPEAKGNVYDIKSGAAGTTRDGRPFADL